MILLKCVYAMRDADREKLREKIAAEVGQEVAILPGGVELATAQKLLFLCDRKACAKCSYCPIRLDFCQIRKAGR